MLVFILEEKHTSKCLGKFTGNATEHGDLLNGDFLPVEVEQWEVVGVATQKSAVVEFLLAKPSERRVRALLTKKEAA